MAAADAVPAIYTIYTALIAAGGISVGAVLSTLSDWGKDKRAAKREIETDKRAIARERATRREETSWRWYENRATFERDTALELQQEIYGYYRAFNVIRRADELAYRQSGKWGLEKTGDPAEELRIRTAAIQQLRVRLFDAALREQVKQYISRCTSSALQFGVESADAKQARKTAMDYEAQAQKLFESINEQLGVIIRKAFESLDPYQVPELFQFPSVIDPPASQPEKSRE
jgi:hypothetical protein